MDELMKCGVCASFVTRDRVLGPCLVCKKRMCTYCHRVCDRCLKMVCQDDAETKEVYRAGTIFRLRLCAFCKGLV